MELADKINALLGINYSPPETWDSLSDNCQKLNDEKDRPGSQNRFVRSSEGRGVSGKRSFARKHHLSARLICLRLTCACAVQVGPRNEVDSDIQQRRARQESRSKNEFRRGGPVGFQGLDLVGWFGWLVGTGQWTPLPLCPSAPLPHSWLVGEQLHVEASKH